MSDLAEKVRENRVRRMASRQGLRLVKSRRRDPRALDFGSYWLVDDRGLTQLGDQHGVSLDAVEEELTR